MFSKKIVGSVISALMLAACADDSGQGSSEDRIVAVRGGFIPEGIEYDTVNGRFLTGSLADGTVYEIARDGSLVSVVTDAELVASVGIEVDESHNRILVASTDRDNPQGAARLGVYALDTGARLALVDLAAAIPDRPADATHFANDVAVSPRGVAYVTDTRMNIIYQVDTYYRASVLLDLGRDSGFNLNGIEYHPNGYLLVVSPGTGQLLKVSPYNSSSWQLVVLDTPATGGDGILWAADGSLAVVSNNQSLVSKYVSDDNWRSARLAGTAVFEGQGTTGAAVGDDIWVVQPHFADQDPPVILRAQF